MALPPEPLIDVLPHATDIVTAEVESVLRTAPPTDTRVVEEGRTGAGINAPSQTVVLVVSRALRGDQGVGAKIVATKPEAGYLLEAGNRGTFLLGGRGRHLEILGRYGPDTYELEAIEAALKDEAQRDGEMEP